MDEIDRLLKRRSGRTYPVTCRIRASKHRRLKALSKRFGLCLTHVARAALLSAVRQLEDRAKELGITDAELGLEPEEE